MSRQLSEVIQPLVFLLIVVSLFPLAVGPSPDVLQRIGPGVIWIAAILSSLLGMERLFRDDFHDGNLEQLLLSNVPLPLVALAKVLSHWILSIVPLIVLSPLLALLFHLSVDTYIALLVTLLLGTPLLSLVGAIAVALTVGVNRGGVLLALLLLPLAIPMLIFSVSAIEAAALALSYRSQLAIIAAMLLLALGLAPFVIAYALRVSHN